MNKTAAVSLARGGPCYADVDLPQELLGTDNLVLVGTEKSNLWLSKISEELPVRIDNSLVVGDGKVLAEGDAGYILIHPNPLNCKKYVVVFSATSAAALDKTVQVYSQLKSICASDVCVFEIDEREKIRFRVIERLNTTWGWHRHWDEVLATVNNRYKDWRWKQWAAATLSELIDADVAIVEHPLRFAEADITGPVTLRDLFRNFRNDWLLKIKLAGRDLRKLLTIPIGGIIEDGTRDWVINGLTPKGLQDNKIYTVVCSENVLSGHGLGMVLADYEIVEEGFIVPLLKRYLCRKESLSLDEELEKVTLNIF